MPYPNEHACRLQSPNKYDKFRRVNGDIDVNGKKADAIYGIKENKSELQAVRFNKEVFETKSARGWCDRHDGTFEPASEKSDIKISTENPLWINQTQNDNECVIEIDDVIGGCSEPESTSINNQYRLAEELKAIANIKSNRIIININSPGGLVSHALAMHDLLASHPAIKIVNIYGMTASAATIIAMAGDKIRMSTTALFLVHKAQGMAMGNSDTLQEGADDLKKIDNLIANIYSKRTLHSVNDISNMMSSHSGDGEWWTAQEALAKGFIDDIYEPEQMKAVALKSDFIGKLPEIPETHKQFFNIINQNFNDMDIIAKLTELKNEILEKINPKENKISEADLQKLIDEKTEVLKAQFEADKQAQEIIANDIKSQNEKLQNEIAKLQAQPIPIASGNDPDILEALRKESSLMTFLVNKFSNKL